MRGDFKQQFEELGLGADVACIMMPELRGRGKKSITESIINKIKQFLKSRIQRQYCIQPIMKDESGLCGILMVKNKDGDCNLYCIDPRGYATLNDDHASLLQGLPEKINGISITLHYVNTWFHIHALTEENDKTLLLWMIQHIETLGVGRAFDKLQCEEKNLKLYNPDAFGKQQKRCSLNLAGSPKELQDAACTTQSPLQHVTLLKNHEDFFSKLLKPPIERTMAAAAAAAATPAHAATDSGSDSDGDGDVSEHQNSPPPATARRKRPAETQLTNQSKKARGKAATPVQSDSESESDGSEHQSSPRRATAREKRKATTPPLEERPAKRREVMQATGAAAAAASAATATPPAHNTTTLEDTLAAALQHISELTQAVQRALQQAQESKSATTQQPAGDPPEAVIITELESNIAALQEEKQRLTTELKETAKEISKLRDAAKAAEKKADEASQKLDTALDRIKELETPKDDASSTEEEKEEMTATLKRAQELTYKAALDIGFKTEEIDSLNVSLKNKENEIAGLKEEIATLQKTLNHKDSIIQQKATEITKEKSTHEKAIAEHSASIYRLETQLGQLTTQNTILTQRAQEEEAALQRVTLKNKEIIEKLNKEIERLNTVLGEKENALQTTRVALKTAQVQIQDLVKQDSTTASATATPTSESSDTPARAVTPPPPATPANTTKTKYTLQEIHKAMEENAALRKEIELLKEALTEKNGETAATTSPGLFAPAPGS